MYEEGAKFFTNQIIDQWNDLSHQLSNTQPIIEFKNKLDMFGQKMDMNIMRGQRPVNFNYNNYLIVIFVNK